jgi:bifunctional DNA-binding transcriptional regulator/antitoxin component of YhaV-PrlF toxin-antitoxin module
MVLEVSEMLEPKAVKLQSKSTKSEKYIQFFVTVPKEFVEALNLRVGDILKVEIREIEVNGTKRKAIVYYRV